MPSVFRVNGHTVSIQDCEKMSDQELYRLLKENLPAVSADGAGGERRQQGNRYCLLEVPYEGNTIEVADEPNPL